MKKIAILLLLVPMTLLAQNVPSLGDPVKAGYFEVVVHSVGAGTKVDTGNPYSDLQAEQGAGFLVFEVSFRNTDRKERTLFSSGTLSFTRDGEEYTINQAETILADGFGILLDTVNPTMTLNTKLVYKIPVDTVGPIYWLPPSGRTWIHVANINPS